MINKRKEVLIIILIILIGGFLRLYRLNYNPPALHGDELGIAYNANSLLKTGKDEYGISLPLNFRNDFMPFIFYLTIPFSAILGIMELTVRLPTALVSITTIPLIYYTFNYLLKDKKLALVITLFAALSTWDIRIARIGVGITLPLFFQLAGTILFLKFINSEKKYVLLSFILFFLSLLSYQTPRITTPLLIISLITVYRKKLSIKKNLLFLSTLFLIFIILPSLTYLFYTPIKSTRFAGISVFTLWKSYLPNNANLIKYIYPASLLKLTSMISYNYLKHFDLSLLFLDNSLLRYHQLENHGLFYTWQMVFIIIGLGYFIRYRHFKQNQLVLAWFFISPIPSALTTGVPYANISRALMMLPIIILFSAKGILITYKYINNHYKKISTFFILLLITATYFSLETFMKSYFIKSPDKYAPFWGLHLKKAAIYVNSLENTVDKIIFTTTSSPQSYMYILFYGKKDPLWLLQNKGERAKIVGYTSFGKYEFRTIDWEKDKNLANTLLIGTPNEIPINEDKNLTPVIINNSVLLKIYRTN